MMGSVLRRAILGLVLVTLVVAFPTASTSKRKPPPSPAAQSWLSYGRNAQLTNYVAPGLTTAAAGRLRQVWTTKLDGAIIASPLYASGAASSSSSDTLFVSTTAGSVYALRPGSGKVLWKRALGVVNSQASCHTTYGISSTGAVDLVRGVMYVISADGWLHALSLRTGAEKRGWPVAVTADRADEEYVWGGLRLLRNIVYVPVASYCDAPGEDGEHADGRLVGVNVDTARKAAVFDPVEGDDTLGGIWGWGGVSVDPSGQQLYTGVGNSSVYDEDCDCDIDDAGYGNSVVKLTPGLRVISSSWPQGYPGNGDLDFGSAPLLFRPVGCPPLAAANSKLGVTFIWNRDALKKGPFTSIMIGGGFAFVGQPS